ncbi:hypothetical protein F5X96DRAFT_690504 [Biscogniauxia mediterranea]|nr:hypothetical protein F5X96DRAFT_690504 [Biscogniauxia mediterranea]
MLAEDDGERRMGRGLKMFPQDVDHDALVLNMFTTATEDLKLLKGLIHIMETAASKSAPLQDRTTRILSEDDRFAEDEARGVLLYDLGVAAYTCKVSSDGTEPVNEALRLWMESREVLAKVGGNNASVARSNATLSLASHDFQSVVEGSHPEHLKAPTKLAEDKPDVYGEKDQAREVLIRQKYQDWGNTAIALSLLGQPDLVTEALCFEIKDIVDKESEDKRNLLDVVTKLAKETVKVVRIQVQDVWEQHQRVEAAKAHVDAHMAAAQKANAPEPVTMVAHRLLQTRLSDLVQFHTPKLNSRDFGWVMECDGRTSEGKMCKNKRDFEKGLYHYTYCSSRDFCRDCLEHLRDTKSDLITVCNPKHRRFWVPSWGDDMRIRRGESEECAGAR